MKKLLLHLGLPKTATTTIQHHLFQELHDKGDINFLGKVVDYDDNGKSFFKNNRGSLIRKACEARLADDISEELDKILVSDKLNVFSDEGIMISYPGKENLPLTHKISKLKQILSGYDVRVMLTLRQPVDYIFSLYVELYPSFYRKNKHLDTFEKYINYLLSDESIDQESAFMHRNVELLSAAFETSVLLFEDIKYQPEYFCEQISDLLQIEKNYVRTAILGNHKNIKKRQSEGVYSERTISFTSTVRVLSEKIQRHQTLHKYLKKIYRSKLLPLEKVSRVNFGKHRTLHQKPKLFLRQQLQQTIGIPECFDFEKFGLNQQKLQKYGYTRTGNND